MVCGNIFQESHTVYSTYMNDCNEACFFCPKPPCGQQGKEFFKSHCKSVLSERIFTVNEFLSHVLKHYFAIESRVLSPQESTYHHLLNKEQLIYLWSFFLIQPYFFLPDFHVTIATADFIWPDLTTKEIWAILFAMIRRVLQTWWNIWPKPL